MLLPEAKHRYALLAAKQRRLEKPAPCKRDHQAIARCIHRRVDVLASQGSTEWAQTEWMKMKGIL